MDLNQFASGLLRMLIMPPANLFVCIALGWLLARRWPRLGRTLSAAGMLLLVVMSTNAGARLLLAPLEEMTAPLAAGQEAGAQAIVVLGAGSVEAAPEYGGLDVPDQVALVRLQYAAHLQHATGLPLLASGGNAAPGRGVQAKADMMARVLRDDFNTPVKWVEGQSSDTAENARFSARILKEAGVTRVLLVTQALHMPRAQAEFVRNGIDVVPAPTLFYSKMAWSPFMLVPSASGLYRSFYAVHEWMGLIWNRLQAQPVPHAPAAKR
jgi:uncharacterized SAM-binding protein YcdF (DUF218 family)